MSRSGFLKLGFLLLTAAFTALPFAAAPVHASLLSMGHGVFGPGALTMDTDTGLKWLDLPLSQGRTWLDVDGQFGPGGDFEGFRHATAAELVVFYTHAGLTNIDSGYMQGDLTPVTDLINLVGTTRSQDNWPEALGFLADPSSMVPMRKAGMLDFVWYGSDPAYRVVANTHGLNETMVFETVGHWLVQPSEIPEPGTLGLLGLGLAGLGWARRRRRS